MRTSTRQAFTHQWLMVTGLALLWLLAAMVLVSPSVSAHGSIENPPSRVYNCYKELTTQTLSPACQALLAEGGAQQLYDWNGVRQGNANGQHRALIPDGTLCGGGDSAFRGLNLARTDWVAQTITPDANGNFEFVFHATAPHATQIFEFYITNDGYDPTEPLAWSSLGATPFCTSGGVPLVDGRYHITCPLPTGKSGKHLIYNIWQRSDSPEAFYSCIDVNFAGAPEVTATPTTPVPTATATSSPGGCTAPAWNAASVYVAENLVAHNGRTWRAKWWTQGEEPGTTGQWGVWEDRGACSGGGNPTPTPTAVAPTATPVASTPTPVGTVTATPTGQPSVGNDTVVAYFTQWGIYQRNYHVKNIATSGSAGKIDVINYAFGNIVNGRCIMTTQAGVMDGYADYQRSYNAAESVDGVADRWDQPLRGNFNQLKKLKALYPGLKVVISLGGWTWSKGFSDAALTPESRAEVVRSCIDIYINGNLPVADNAGGPGAAAGVFDGIDIDWEYPAAPGDVGHIYRPEDTQNYTLLLAEFRRQLDAINPNLLLTVATPAGQATYSKMQLNQIHQYLNWINIMSYDLHGSWEATTNFHSHLRLAPGDTTGLSVANAVQGYLAAGVPANKLIVGIPFYGRGWTGVRNQNNGLYQPASGAAPGTYEAGFEDYKVLKTRTMPSFRDPVTGGFWLYDGNTFWSYDDPQVIAEKMAWLQNLGLRGAMVWSLDGDDAAGTLMSAVRNGLSGAAAGVVTPEQGTTQPFALFLPVVTNYGQ